MSPSRAVGPTLLPRLAAGALLLAVVVALGACSLPEEPPPPAEAGEPEDSLIVAEGFVADKITSGTLSHRIMAARAVHNETRRFVELDNLHVLFFDSEGDEVEGELWSNAGVLYLVDTPTSAALQNDFDLFGSPEHPVQFRNAKTNDTLLAHQIRWNDQEAWGEKIGVLRSEGWYRMLRFRDTPDQVALFEGEGIVTERTLNDFRFINSSIRSATVTPEDIAGLRPEPRADAPRYEGRE